MLRIFAASLIMGGIATFFYLAGAKYGMGIPEAEAVPEDAVADEEIEAESLAPEQEQEDPGWQVEYIDLNNLDPVSTISKGEKVTIDRHLAKSGMTLVEFTADW